MSGKAKTTVQVLVLLICLLGTTVIAADQNRYRSTIRSISDDASRHVLIDKDDNIYQAYADIALANSGKLICVWRETATHASGSWSRLVMKKSSDMGRIWSDRTILSDNSEIDST